MTYFTVCCGYASHYHNTVTIEADTRGATAGRRSVRPCRRTAGPTKAHSGHRAQH